jgi:hypothetical protein
MEGTIKTLGYRDKYKPDIMYGTSMNKLIQVSEVELEGFWKMQGFSYLLTRRN